MNPDFTLRTSHFTLDFVTRHASRVTISHTSHFTLDFVTRHASRVTISHTSHFTLHTCIGHGFHFNRTTDSEIED